MSPPPPLPSVFSPVKSDSQNVASRQQAINSAYDKLLQSAEVLQLVQMLLTIPFIHGIWSHFSLLTSGCVYKFCNLPQARHQELNGSIRQFGLFRECDDVESWIKEKVSPIAKYGHRQR